MEYQDYIKSELLVLIPVMYFIGIGLKKSALPDKRIPTMLGLVSVLLSAVWVMATGKISCMQEGALAFFTAVTQGILIAGVSVYVNQLHVQRKKEEQ